MKIKRYKKESEFSYCLGVFPSIELLQKKSDYVEYVFIKSEGEINSGVSKIKEICKSQNIPYGIHDKEISNFAYKENTYVVTKFRKYASNLEEDKNHIVLVNPKNMGNLGTIIRTMVAFGYYNLVLIRPAADIFDPKVISSTMGAFFQINFEYFDSLQQYLKQYRKNNRRIYTFVINEAKDIRNIKETGDIYSLVYGNEGAGLNETDSREGERIMIPQKGDVDSLNLSIAVGISLYEFTYKK